MCLVYNLSIAYIAEQQTTNIFMLHVECSYTNACITYMTYWIYRKKKLKVELASICMYTCIVYRGLVLRHKNEGVHQCDMQ